MLTFAITTIKNAYHACKFIRACSQFLSKKSNFEFQRNLLKILTEIFFILYSIVQKSCATHHFCIFLLPGKQTFLVIFIKSVEELFSLNIGCFISHFQSTPST